jgi:PAS domain S-box-containing protein
MKKNKVRNQATASELRRDAEERLGGKNPAVGEGALQKLVHELEVYQIELEMQNTELRRANDELELARNKFAELYDFAPVGYFTFDSHGMITELNLTATQLLGVERRLLIDTPFSNFITDPEGRHVFASHLATVLHNQAPQRCEIKLKVKDGALIHGQIQSVMVDTCDGGLGCVFSSLIDETAKNILKEELEKAHDNLELLVAERTRELTAANALLTLEIVERQKAEGSCQQAYGEIVSLKNRLQAENALLQQDVASKYNFGQIIGQSTALSQVFLRVEQVAPMNATVLLLGETGTGKGVIARAIHGRSVRKGRSMITVNCSSLPANLIESELFGREKGAFTGSTARQIGRFELADGGTIFLDEIGEMPLELQPKLLRVIQDGEFERLGSPRTIKTDVRIIAASNRDLEEEIRQGRFREDLFYRLNVFPITLPPLRQRRDDIPLLVSHFLGKFNKKMGKKIDSVSQATLNLFQHYQWPGNVRELESVMERAVIISRGTTLEVVSRCSAVLKKDEPEVHDDKTLAQLEHDHILQVLQKTAGRIEGKNGAAILLGLNPSTLRARMRKLGIPRQ